MPVSIQGMIFLRVGDGGLWWWLRCAFKNIEVYSVRGGAKKIKVFSMRRGYMYKDIEKKTHFLLV